MITLFSFIHSFNYTLLIQISSCAEQFSFMLLKQPFWNHKNKIFRYKIEKVFLAVSVFGFNWIASANIGDTWKTIISFESKFLKQFHLSVTFISLWDSMCIYLSPFISYFRKKYNKHKNRRKKEANLHVWKKTCIPQRLFEEYKLRFFK